ncbi:hypothetical protein MSIBF_A150007 [groundwater metagenome]|uniref:Glycosyltransferase 2-like domain-containing protein n=1 Tax=groundwater metagenome TaxID=717931 RepID=A0A098E7N3_9ZZZZ
MNEKEITNELPSVSIIVLTYNGKGHLKECFESLENLNYPKDKYEVIMADNASSDGSVEYVKKNFSSIKILRLDKNYGYAGGNNKSVEISKGEYIAFLNNDTLVDKNWLNELIKWVIKNPEMICSSIMLDYNNKEKVAANVVKKSAFGLNICVTAGIKYSTQNLSQQYTAYPFGSGMLIRRDIFLLLGGFDSSYFMYGEDASLGWKAWLFGYTIVTVPSSIYWHKIRASSGNGGRSPMYIYLFWRNCMVNILKYAELQNVIKMLSLFLIVSFAASALFLIKKQFSLIFAIFNAHFSFITMLPDVLKERKIIQSKRKISDKKLYEKKVFMPLDDSIREMINFVRNFN